MNRRDYNRLLNEPCRNKINSYRFEVNGEKGIEIIRQ